MIYLDIVATVVVALFVLLMARYLKKCLSWFGDGVVRMTVALCMLAVLISMAYITVRLWLA
jgi:hypothetical protein